MTEHELLKDGAIRTESSHMSNKVSQRKLKTVGFRSGFLPRHRWVKTPRRERKSRSVPYPPLGLGEILRHE